MEDNNEYDSYANKGVRVLFNVNFTIRSRVLANFGTCNRKYIV